MEKRNSEWYNHAPTEYLDRLMGPLNIETIYYAYGDSVESLGPEVRDYFDERNRKIAEGEDTWMAQDMADPLQRTLLYYSDKKLAGGLTMNLVTREFATFDAQLQPIMAETDDLVKAVDVVESQLVKTN